MATKKAFNQQGFTLIELVIVIAILGILAGIAIPRFMDSRASAAGSKLLGDLRTLDSASEVYQAKNGSMPTMDLLVEDGMIAAKAVPPTGTILIVNNSGVSVKYEASATEYVLDAEGRATYTSDKLTNGKVEQYLGKGNGSASYNEIVRLAQAALAAGNLGAGGQAIDDAIKDANGGFPAVEDSLAKSVFGDDYNTGLEWRVNSDWKHDKVIYFATTNVNGNTNAGWNASLVVVDGILYKSTSTKDKSIAQAFGDAANISDVAAKIVSLGFEKVGPISGF